MANQIVIPLSAPDVGPIEEEHVRKAVRSGWVAPVGPALEEFEELVAQRAKRKFAVAVSSGTAALHLGLIALGVRPGDLVMCSNLTFVATVNAITYTGAIPILIDSDRQTGNISVDLLRLAIDEAHHSGSRIGAVVPVDFLGRIAEYSRIAAVCEPYGIPVLADAAESVGSTQNGVPSGRLGDASIFSFNGNKIATTSGGGAFLTDDADQANYVRFLASQARERVRHYEHRELGFNYRMSNILAAIGVAQFRRLDGFLERREFNRKRYRDFWSTVSGVTVLGDDDFSDNCWLTAILVDPGMAGFNSVELANFLDYRGIETRPLWKPMHAQPLYSRSKIWANGTSDLYFAQGLALPSGSSLSLGDWSRLESVLEEFISTRKKLGT